MINHRLADSFARQKRDAIFHYSAITVIVIF